ncbi:MAG TPA: carboxypeptidase-like regulatory domain-containing protein, partial [Bacteroidales bacterium]|nr:carboxypeptidase-like regulatory domain-containing protein [Bacteroidales bacterium]
MSGTLMAQNIRVTGKVIDKTGQPLMGVSVLIEGTRTGVATELDGTFSMEVPANAVLQFSAIGMENL